MVMHGFPTTLQATLPLMCHHIAAVRRGAPKKFLVGDMPFLSYRKNLSDNMTAVEHLTQAGAEALKLEGAGGNTDFIKHCVQSGVPIMGHLGLTPQSVHQLGGFRVQGRGEHAEMLFEDALRVEDAGCFALVLECVPRQIAQRITERLQIPTIGIGAGVDCDGQVLVLQDMLGMNPDFKPRFLRQFANGFQILKEALNSYDANVKSADFPNSGESYE
jgi:3-methyl-2-oxobutanoate hydroxymethyltransferase